MKEKIIFKVNASSKIGFGHFKRCLNLAHILKDKGFELFLQSNLDNPLLDSAEAKIFVEHSVLPVDLSLEEDNQQLIKQALKHEVGWVVLDGYNFDSTYEKNIQLAGLKLFRIDDVPTHLYHCDVLLSQNFGAEEMDFKVDPGTSKALGLKYLLLGPEFLNSQMAQPQVKKNLPLNILISLGGYSAQTRGLYQEMLAGLNQQSLGQKLIYTFLIPDAELCLELQGRYQIPEVVVQGYCEDMSSLMLKSDFAITTPGTTMWELMYCGVPFAAVPLNQNQDHYARKLLNHKLLLKLPLVTQCRWQDVCEILERICSTSLERQQMADRYFNLLGNQNFQSNVSQLFYS